MAVCASTLSFLIILMRLLGGTDPHTAHFFLFSFVLPSALFLFVP